MLFSFTVHAQAFLTRAGHISFYAPAPLGDIAAVNDQIRLSLDLSTGAVRADLPVKSFVFKRRLMQKHFNEQYMHSDAYPTAAFAGLIRERLLPFSGHDSTYAVTAEGQLTIHGQTRAVSVPALVTVSKSGVTVQTKFRLRPADYGVRSPRMVVVPLARTIDVTVVSELHPVAGN
jgi:polyisoprenoid-binding protein YceI